MRDPPRTLQIDDRPIGLFDSGVGGLTVLRTLLRSFPNERFLYLGDTARAPYGTKPRQDICRFSLDNSQFLLEQNCKIIVVACHTSSAHALPHLQETLPIPVLGMIDPAIEALMQATRNQTVGLLATPGTIASNVYQAKIQALYPHTRVTSIGCPLFVPLAEEGLFDHPAAEPIARHYLSSLQGRNIDALLLACTHYPLFRRILQEILGPTITLIDPAERCARHLQQHLRPTSQRSPSVQFFTTASPEKFRQIASHFLGTSIDRICVVEKTLA